MADDRPRPPTEVNEDNIDEYICDNVQPFRDIQERVDGLCTISHQLFDKPDVCYLIDEIGRGLIWKLKMAKKALMSNRCESIIFPHEVWANICDFLCGSDVAALSATSKTMRNIIFWNIRMYIGANTNYYKSHESVLNPPVVGKKMMIPDYNEPHVYEIEYGKAKYKVAEGAILDSMVSITLLDFFKLAVKFPKCGKIEYNYCMSFSTWPGDNKSVYSINIHYDYNDYYDICGKCLKVCSIHFGSNWFERSHCDLCLNSHPRNLSILEYGRDRREIDLKSDAGKLELMYWMARRMSPRGLAMYALDTFKIFEYFPAFDQIFDDCLELYIKKYHWYISDYLRG